MIENIFIKKKREHLTREKQFNAHKKKDWFPEYFQPVNTPAWERFQ